MMYFIPSLAYTWFSVTFYLHAHKTSLSVAISLSVVCIANQHPVYFCNIRSLFKSSTGFIARFKCTEYIRNTATDEGDTQSVKGKWQRGNHSTVISAKQFTPFSLSLVNRAMYKKSWQLRILKGCECPWRTKQD